MAQPKIEIVYNYFEDGKLAPTEKVPLQLPQQDVMSDGFAKFMVNRYIPLKIQSIENMVSFDVYRDGKLQRRYHFCAGLRYLVNNEDIAGTSGRETFLSDLNPAAIREISKALKATPDA